MLFQYHQQEIDTTNKGYLSPSDFTLLLKNLKCQPEIQAIYDELTKNGPLDEKKFGSFLLGIQKSRCTKDEISRIFAGLVGMREEKRGGVDRRESVDAPVVLAPIALSTPVVVGSGDLQPSQVDSPPAVDTPPQRRSQSLSLSLDQLTTFLLSPDNAVLHPSQRKICQDMTRPLAEYFVSSSHNTYLVGNQWRGDSTIEGYVRALLAGCRSVEG